MTVTKAATNTTTTTILTFLPERITKKEINFIESNDSNQTVSFHTRVGGNQHVNLQPTRKIEHFNSFLLIHPVLIQTRF